MPPSCLRDTRSAVPTFCGARWARRIPRRWPRSGGNLSKVAARPTASARPWRARFSRRSKCSRAMDSINPTRPATVTFLTGPLGSRRITRSSSWPRCSRTKSTTPTRSACLFLSAIAWASRSCRPTSMRLACAFARRRRPVVVRGSATGWRRSRTAAKRRWPRRSRSARRRGNLPRSMISRLGSTRRSSTSGSLKTSSRLARLIGPVKRGRGCLPVSSRSWPRHRRCNATVRRVRFRYSATWDFPRRHRARKIPPARQALPSGARTNDLRMRRNCSGFM